MPILPPPPFLKIGTLLAKRVPELKPLITHVGPCKLQPHPDKFRVLASSIISQQISGKAAESIKKRVIEACGRGGLKAKRLAELSDEELRGAGLSGSKVLSLRSLSKFFLENVSVIRQLDRMPEEEVIEVLLPIRGVGVWTAQMFLMFCLGRPDILPTGDLGLKAGVRDIYGYDDYPPTAMLEEIAEAWRPYRSVATWYMWQKPKGFGTGTS